MDRIIIIIIFFFTFDHLLSHRSISERMDRTKIQFVQNFRKILK